MTKCIVAAIRSYNEKVVEWTAGGFGRIAPLLTEDLFYWNERRVYDADDLSVYLDTIAYAAHFEDAFGLAPPADLRMAFAMAEPRERKQIIEDLSRLPPLSDPEYDELVEG